MWGGDRRSSVEAEETDYDRACEVRDEVAVIASGEGSALVLGDEPLATGWWPTEHGGWLLRWVYGSSEADLLRGVPRAGAEQFPSGPHLEFTTGTSGECILIDAADPGDEPLRSQLSIRLVPGSYKVDTMLVDVDPENRLLVHRLHMTGRPINP